MEHFSCLLGNFEEKGRFAWLAKERIERPAAVPGERGKAEVGDVEKKAEKTLQKASASLDKTAQEAKPDLQTRNYVDAATYATNAMRGKKDLSYGACFRAVVEGFGGDKAWKAFTAKYNQVQSSLKGGAEIDAFQTAWARQHLGDDVNFCVEELQIFLKNKRDGIDLGPPQFEREQKNEPAPEPSLPEVSKGEPVARRGSVFEATDTPETMQDLKVSFESQDIRDVRGVPVTRLTVTNDNIVMARYKPESEKWSIDQKLNVQREGVAILAAQIEPLLKNATGRDLKLTDVYPGLVNSFKPKKGETLVRLNDALIMKKGSTVDFNPNTLRLTVTEPAFTQKTTEETWGDKSYVVDPDLKNEAVVAYLRATPAAKIEESSLEQSVLAEIGHEKAEFPQHLDGIRDLASISGFNGAQVFRKGDAYFIHGSAGLSDHFVYKVGENGGLAISKELSEGLGKIDNSFVRQGEVLASGRLAAGSWLTVAQKEQFEKDFGVA